MKRVLVTLNQVNRIVQENFKRRLFEEASKIEKKSDFQSVGKGGVNKPEDVKHILDLFSNEKVGMAKEVQDVIEKCSSKGKTSSSTETNNSSKDKSPSELLDAITSSSTTSTTSKPAEGESKTSSENSNIDYAAIGDCTEFHNMIADYQKTKVFSGFSDSRIDTAQATINTLYGEILGYENISNATVRNITQLSTNEKLVFEALKKQGFTDETTAAVMGVASGESGFQTFKELSYSTTPNSRIRAIFGGKLGNKTDAELDTLKKSDKAFFNAVYGGMYGNAPDEGYLYVGRGFNGITFKANYQDAQNCSGINFVSNPELMEDPKNAAAALACYFRTIKNESDLKKAFEKAYVLNAGIGNSFATYANSQNIVHKVGMPTRWGNTQSFYNYIKQSTEKTA